MAILSFNTSRYANNVYLQGTYRLNARAGYTGDPTVDGYTLVPRSPDDYYTPVETYANKNFDIQTLDTALANGWINQQEYDETKALGPMPAIKNPLSTTTPTA